jgi:hypothetical protein
MGEVFLSLTVHFARATRAGTGFGVSPVLIGVADALHSRSGDAGLFGYLTMDLGRFESKQ